MSKPDSTKYFDLFTSGIGYLNRVREVTPQEGSPFWSVTIAALRGPTDAVQYTRFECRVSGKQAQELMTRLAEAVQAERHVLIGFTLSDLVAEPFTFKSGERAGQTGISLKARLLRVGWAKVDGESVYTEQAAA